MAGWARDWGEGGGGTTCGNSPAPSVAVSIPSMFILHIIVAGNILVEIMGSNCNISVNVGDPSSVTSGMPGSSTVTTGERENNYSHTCNCCCYIKLE